MHHCIILWNRRAGQVNLFTYLFDLLLTGKITAYEYKLDGNESFTQRDKADIKELMNRHHIYYEEQNGRPRVSASDIPSAEVTRYYIKESSYFDQRTSTFRTKVVAICPVLMRGDDFGGEATAYPLFWLKYDDISTYPCPPYDDGQQLQQHHEYDGGRLLCHEPL